MTADTALPELASVPWRQRTDERWLARWGRIWQAWTLLYTVPFALAGVGMVLMEPLTAPVALAAVAHAWIIPELYAYRGASVVRPKVRATRTPNPWRRACSATCSGTTRASSSAAPGWRSNRGLGTWLVGEAGALLVMPGARRVHCFCVRAGERELPPSDRVAHLLLALREDERGFATVATMPSPAPRGGYAAGCPPVCGRALAARAAARGVAGRKHPARPVAPGKLQPRS